VFAGVGRSGPPRPPAHSWTVNIIEGYQTGVAPGNDPSSNSIFGPDSDIKRVVSKSVPQGTALLGDFTKLRLYVRQDAHVDIDASGTLFRIAHNVWSRKGPQADARESRPPDYSQRAARAHAADFLDRDNRPIAQVAGPDVAFRDAVMFEVAVAGLCQSSAGLAQHWVTARTTRRR
jgi:hypothetical protein